MATITQCGISDATELHSLWKLPALPLTERFGPYRAGNALAHDQELVISLPTGHVQLRRQLDPALLYTSGEYSFRTGASDSARRSVDAFVAFVNGLVTGRTFDSIVDVGGNDLFVARALEKHGRHRAVVDPICAKQDGQQVDGIRVLGRLIEQVELGRDLPPPDLLVCRHTLEHVAQPRTVVRQWLQQCRPDCLYVVEVPCFASLVEAQRFDAIFHQHLHYFDVESLRHLVWACGGEYVAHGFNRQGPCGGALMFAFRRATTVQERPRIDTAARVAHIEARISRYREQMALMSALYDELPGPVYGYGASLMLASLGYHLRTDFSKLAAVLDDDPTKDGTTYENVPVTVRHTKAVAPAPDSSYVITSLENTRPIYRRILELQPRRILVPMIQ